MRTCPHMSPGCSSPRDLNIAPARHYCCHSQTHSDLLTSPAQKRLDADTFTANVFHQCKKKEREKERQRARDERRRSARRLFFIFTSASVLLFPLPPKYCLTFAGIDWRQADDGLTHRSDGWTFLNTWCTTGGQRSEFDGHLLVLSLSLGDVSSASSCSATCGQCAPSHRSLSLPLILHCSCSREEKITCVFFFLTPLYSCPLSFLVKGRKVIQLSSAAH